MKYVCKICGYIHEGDSAPEKCPKCGQTGVFVAASNPYAGTQTEKNLLAVRGAIPGPKGGAVVIKNTTRAL